MSPWIRRASLVSLLLTTSASASAPVMDAGASPADAAMPLVDAASQDTAPSAPAITPLPALMDKSAHIVAYLDSAKQGLLLLGASGEIYTQSGPLQWQRDGNGGVSASVIGCFEAADGTLYAVGTRSPLFVRRQGIWSASPLVNRGQAAISRGPTPVISSGRHIYQLQAKGWQRIASTKSRLRALWTSNAKRIYVATAMNVLAVGGPRNWKSLTAPSFADGEEVNQIVGVGKQVVAVTNQNKVLLLGAKKATQLSFNKALEGFDIQALGVFQGTVILAGQIGMPDGQRRSVLARVEAAKVNFHSDLWPLANGDRFAVLRADNTGLLVVSQQGQVRHQSPAGVWSTGQIAVDVPVSVVPTAEQRPARSN